MNWQDIKPVPKVTASVVAAAIMAIVVYVLDAGFGVELPEFVVYAGMVIIVAIAGWFAPRVDA